MPYLLPVLTSIYAARVAFFYVGMLREKRRWKPATGHPAVSIVVPARNEEQNIERCVRSLLRSDYAINDIEFIFVDDRSTDNTGAILDRLALSDQRIRVIHRTDSDVDPNLRGKPGALQHGISDARSEIVLLTDADCAVKSSWIRGMVGLFEDTNVGIVSAFTSIQCNTFLERVQDVEWLYTQSMACGGAGNNVPLGCFGNNMGIRKSVFAKLGGYKAIPFSVTEDMALQIATHNAGYQVRFAVSPLTNVETLPIDSMAEYIKQRHRWIRGGRGLGIRGWMFVLTSIALWCGIVLSAVEEQWQWLCTLLALRFVGDGALIGYAALSIRRYALMPFIIPSMAILWLTELAMPFISMKKTVVWKGQTFR